MYWWFSGEAESVVFYLFFHASRSVSFWFNLLQNTIAAMTPKLSKQFLQRAIIHFWLNCYQYSSITQPEKDSVRENKTFSFVIWRQSPLKSQGPLTTDNQSPHQLNPMGNTAKSVMFCNVNSGWSHFPTTWFNLRPLHFVIFFENPPWKCASACYIQTDFMCRWIQRWRLVWLFHWRKVKKPKVKSYTGCG